MNGLTKLVRNKIRKVTCEFGDLGGVAVGVPPDMVNRTVLNLPWFLSFPMVG